MDNSRLETVSFLVLLAGVFLLTFFVFAPFLKILALAAVFAILFQPLYVRLTRIFGTPTLAAGIIVTANIVFFIAPVFLLGSQVLREGQRVYAHLQGDGGHELQLLVRTIEDPIRQLFPSFSFHVADYAARALGFVSNNLSALVSQTVSVIFQTLLMLIAFFFFLRDGEHMLALLKSRSPIEKSRSDQLLDRVRRTVTVVIKGTLLVALLRWLIVAIAFAGVGIPNALLWGSVAGIIGAIPGLGTVLAILPAVAYLLFQGNAAAAVVLTIVGTCIVIALDNILTAHFFGKELAVSPVFILFSILGGLISFGPLTLSLFLSLLQQGND